MRCVLLPTVVLLFAGSAHAEDFTGFYAGINAGYARGHADERTTAADGTLSPVAKPGADLPPSARDAALTLRRLDSHGSGVPAGR
ncbi:hypothetical protein SAMN05216360_103282 [Methylobacterium phyllostachyos]|uniref:Uncharacterized protein n=1 Tax=Methylobacterium phyllostachyos TaxID=582672 RepID=A0A1G9VT40_9HYPH|nr:hypothetical protein SAMN05216360_103282 [Methylobacterium phyllostachyos]